MSQPTAKPAAASPLCRRIHHGGGAGIPDIAAITVANDDTVCTPLGTKDIGETPMAGVAAATANALYHATGVRGRKLPLRIGHVMAI